MTQYLVRCDRCGQAPTTRWRPTFTQALRDAKTAGWDCDGKVRCRDCLNDETNNRGRSCRDGCHESLTERWVRCWRCPDRCPVGACRRDERSEEAL